MAVKIRLARVGRRKAPYYRIVVADSRRARDGRFIEIVGRYQPLQKNENQYHVNEERALRWLSEGAIPSDTVRSIFRRLGIMRRFHEQRQARKKARAASAAVQGGESASPAEPDAQRQAATEAEAEPVTTDSSESGPA